MKFGNQSQIDLIAAEVGGAVGAAPPDSQIELFDALIDGCREAVERGNLDVKVGLKIIGDIELNATFASLFLVCSCILTSLRGNYS